MSEIGKGLTDGGSPLAIEEITALGEGTTPGGWWIDARHVMSLYGVVAQVQGLSGGRPHSPNEALIAAAPALREAALAAMTENERLRRENDMLRRNNSQSLNMAHADTDRRVAERDTARAEVTVLREALSKIASLRCLVFEQGCGYRPNPCVSCIARAALARFTEREATVTEYPEHNHHRTDDGPEPIGEAHDVAYPGCPVREVGS